jgi:serine/threonine-protein kinase
LESNLALSDLSNGKPDLADQEVRSAIARFRRIPRPPVQLSTAEANLGILERLRGHPQAAREAFESAVDVIRQSGLRDYPPLLSLEIELAYERGLEGDARAEADLRALFAKTAAPPGNVERVRALLALGHVLARNGKPQEAEPLLRESLGMRERLPKRDYRIAQAEFALAECFEAERRIPEARQMYQAALTDFRDHVGAEIWAARETAAHLQRISSEQ